MSATATAAQITGTTNAVYTPNSTYGVEPTQNEFGIESMNIDINAWDKGAKATIEIRLTKVPRTPHELAEYIADDYLKAKGIDKTLEEIIDEFLPEYKV